MHELVKHVWVPFPADTSPSPMPMSSMASIACWCSVMVVQEGDTAVYDLYLGVRLAEASSQAMWGSAHYCVQMEPVPVSGERQEPFACAAHEACMNCSDPLEWTCAAACGEQLLRFHSSRQPKEHMLMPLHRSTAHSATARRCLPPLSAHMKVVLN